MFLDRIARCGLRTFKIKSKLLIFFSVSFINLASFVEEDKRMKELCNFMIVETTQVAVNTFKYLKNIKEAKFDIELNVK